MARRPFEDEDEFQDLQELHRLVEKGGFTPPVDGFLPKLTREEMDALIKEIATS